MSEKDAAVAEPEFDEAARAAYYEFLDDALREPIKFLKHDARAHDDEALYRLVNEHGMEWYGWYWLLAELLTARKDHAYDVSDAMGWRRLRLDMSCMCDITDEQCREFVARLLDAGLIDRQHYDELGQVVIRRVKQDGVAYAETVAAKKLGAWKTNRRRLNI